MSSSSSSNNNGNNGIQLNTSGKGTARLSFTFKTQQDIYRKKVEKFFAVKDHYVRLKTLVEKRSDIFTLIQYFVTKYSANRLFPVAGGVFCPLDAYHSAVRSHHKTFYDFESREGYGRLWYDHLHNPNVLVNPAEPDGIALPLPKLVAMMWFIQHQFDEVLLTHFDSVSTEFHEFREQKKHQYSSKHKAKRHTIRSKMEERVIQEREERERAASENGEAKEKKRRKRKAVRGCPRKKTRLTREERRRVGELIAKYKEDQKKLATQIRRNRKAAKKKKKVDVSPKIKPTTAMMEVDSTSPIQNQLGSPSMAERESPGAPHLVVQF